MGSGKLSAAWCEWCAWVRVLNAMPVTYQCEGLDYTAAGVVWVGD